jgi:D-lactate dehydrogenase (cytochrome)
MDTYLIDELAQLLGNRFTTGEHERQQHGKDESSLEPLPPDAVCFPLSTHEVSSIVQCCHRYHTPVIPFGAGSSLEGHIFAPQGGVSIDLSRMNQILRVSADDLDCTVQAGVTRQQLDKHLRPLGMFFPVDPGADATIGGMASTRASGTNAVRHGTMSENILMLKVVLPDGQIIKTGTRARKSAAGYDLTHLFIGAEGTLGVITEVTLRLQGVPEAISAAVVGFRSFESAVQAVTQVRQIGVPVARIEFLDEIMVQAVNKFAGLSLIEQPTLFLEFHGSNASVKENAELVGEIMHDMGGSDFKWAVNQAERTALWTARHNAYYASLAFRPGCRALTTDVCVPISRLAECIVETKHDLEDSSLSATIVGHVGDGNFHMLMLVDPNKPEDYAEAARINERLVQRALAMDGTITGEHGVGMGKKKYMQSEHGAEALAVMRAIKRALDPENLMNPGKMLPEAQQLDFSP